MRFLLIVFFVDFNVKVTPQTVLECAQFIMCPVGGSAELEEQNFDPREKTHFRLYTRKNPDKDEFIKLNDYDGLRRSNFDPSKPTRVLIHGYQNQHRSPINQKLKAAYLSKFNVNVIVSSWGYGSQSLCYKWAVRRTKKVGNVIAEFLDFILGDNITAWEQLIIVGHSLGAHISGFAGKAVKKGKVGAIFGLDPGRNKSR